MPWRARRSGGSPGASSALGMPGRDAGGSARRSVIERRGVRALPDAARRLTSCRRKRQIRTMCALSPRDWALRVAVACLWTLQNREHRQDNRDEVMHHLRQALTLLLIHPSLSPGLHCRKRFWSALSSTTSAARPINALYAMRASSGCTQTCKSSHGTCWRRAKSVPSGTHWLPQRP